MPFQIIRNDITKVSADAVVNTANPRVCIGGGTDSAIYDAAGKDLLLAAREKIGEITPGQAAVTDAFALKARYIIHTVGPVWIDGSHGERDILRSCYQNSLDLADKLKCESIAFPLIASGTYGFPKDEALHIALTEIQRFLLTHEMNVILVVFDRRALELSESLVGGIEQYIDDHTAHSLSMRERMRDLFSNFPWRRRRQNTLWDEETPDFSPDFFKAERKEKASEEPSFTPPFLDDYDFFLKEEKPEEESSEEPVFTSSSLGDEEDFSFQKEDWKEDLPFPSGSVGSMPGASEPPEDDFFAGASFAPSMYSSQEEFPDEGAQSDHYPPPSAPSADYALSEKSYEKKSEAFPTQHSVLPKAEPHHGLSSPSIEPGKSLSDVLKDAGESFQERLFKLIDESGMDDVTVYKKANIDRKVFSRIRCKPDYRPTKKTAVAFAIALELDMPTMKDLLSRAEIALSPHNPFDLIISYFVTNKIYDIFEINAALFKYGQPILGE